MTEAESLRWLVGRFGADKVERLGRYVDILVRETERQNLISKATIPVIWARHIADSAQLLDHAPDDWTHWADIGSGAGLPGIVISTLTNRKVTLIEPRRLRAEFLSNCARELAIDVEVVQAKAEQVSNIPKADVVSARAVAGLPSLFAASKGFATRDTVFVLPKGEGAYSEVAVARQTWQGRFHVEQSIVDPASGIVIATRVAAR